MERYLSKQRFVAEKLIENEPPNKKQKKNACLNEMQCSPTTSSLPANTVGVDDNEIACSSTVEVSVEFHDDVPHYARLAREPSLVEMEEIENFGATQNQNENYAQPIVTSDESHETSAIAKDRVVSA